MINSGYSAADIYAMQKEAEQRVFEMQRRARRTLEDQPEQNNAPCVNDEPHLEDTQQEIPQKAFNGKAEGIMKLLNGDKETALIALVLLLLLKENSNEPVIFVLAYLLFV